MLPYGAHKVHLCLAIHELSTPQPNQAQVQQDNMPTASSHSSGDNKADTSTSGPGAKASAKSSDDNGTFWISTSKDEETITKKIFDNKDEFSKSKDKDVDSESSWTLLGSRRSKQSDDSNDGDGPGASASAAAGKSSTSASSGGSKGANAGVVNGKAFASAG